MARTLRLRSAGIMVVLALAGCGSTRLVSKPSATPGALQGAATRVTVPSPISLNDIAMVSSEDGWGIGSGTVVATADGGRNWRNVTPPGFPKTSARLLSLGSLVSAFPTVHDGIIAQEQASTIRVWRTTDGGVKWQVVTWKAPEAVRLRDFFEGSLLMRFRNVNDGLLILSAPGNPGSSSDTLLTTTDGGRQWHLLHMTQKISATYLGPSPSAQLADIGGVSLHASGWGLASIDTVLAGRAWILTTVDSGHAWTSRTIPLSSGFAHDSVYEGAQVGQGAEGEWLWLDLTSNTHFGPEHWLIEHTTDGGAQWTQIPWTQPIPRPSTLGGVYLWPLGQRVLLLVADSHGTEVWQWAPDQAQWHPMAHLPVAKISSVSLLPNGDGWIIGDSGYYQTTNGGATWQRFSPMLN